ASFAETPLTFEVTQPSVFFDTEPGVPYRGQESVKRRLHMMIETLTPEERLKVLLTGPAGSGKTALAWIVAHRIQNKHRSLGGSAGRLLQVLPSQITTKAELDAFIRQLRERDIVFIDEIHIPEKTVGAAPLYHTLDDTGVPRYPLGQGQG